MTPEEKRQYDRQYREKNRERISERKKKNMKQWHLNNPDYNKRWKEANPGAYQKWVNKNREVLNLKRKKYKISSPEGKLAVRIRNRVYSVLRKIGAKKNESFKEYIGCTVSYLVVHIESQFKPGMTWENQGQWHIDHIIPLSIATSTEEVMKLCHYKNLQPLWAKENIVKGYKMPDNMCELAADLGLNINKGSHK